MLSVIIQFLPRAEGARVEHARTWATRSSKGVICFSLGVEVDHSAHGPKKNIQTKWATDPHVVAFKKPPGQAWLIPISRAWGRGGSSRGKDEPEVARAEAALWSVPRLSLPRAVDREPPRTAPKREPFEATPREKSIWREPCKVATLE